MIKNKCLEVGPGQNGLIKLGTLVDTYIEVYNIDLDMFSSSELNEWYSLDSGADFDDSSDYDMNIINPHLEGIAKYVTHVGDATDLPFEDNTFELTVSHRCLGHALGTEVNIIALNEMVRVTKNHGWIVITAGDEDYPRIHFDMFNWIVQHQDKINQQALRMTKNGIGELVFVLQK